MDFQDIDEQQPQQRQVAIYSKWAILAFSVFFAPLMGGILLMINLRSVGFKRQATGILLFSIAYQFVAAMVIGSVLKLPANINRMALLHNTQFIIYSLVSQIIGGGILAEYFYKKYFPDDNYKYKSVWRPLAVILIITLTIGLLR
ncbi:hypothetical protein [Mucilaginibacter sp. BT774]|uniref:hypothetical protein n=1 Tax=Mucilaginibacter sp. BT774 TaxID=3062276 RepID=UPI0026750DFF|nr:hypothetical protein [Mucilaginibacter sp. BT774]